MAEQKLSDTQRDASARGLPGMQPVGSADWLTIDAAYTRQLEEKAALIAERSADVLMCLPEAQDASQEALEDVLSLLRARSDFVVGDEWVTRPDGVTVPTDADNPLHCISTLIQEDICILQKQGDIHHLTAALLCFPASWTLSEKIGRGLPAIHMPVHDYTDDVARRVQRLFEGVRVGHPIWRANLLSYSDAALYQPKSENEPRDQTPADAAFERSERQTLWRLPKTGAVVFSIHTTLIPL